MQPELKHFKSLDGIRGLACLLVVFFHSPLPAFQLGFGWAGVNLFFILSGFLITRILYRAKTNDFRIFIKNFYARRILRIFPLYFFYLICIFIVLSLLNQALSAKDQTILQGLSDLKSNYPYFITYTYNFEGIFNFLNGKDYHNSMFTGHLWTLSVEEQFYILYPLAIYFLSEKNLKRICILTIIIVPFIRLLAVLFLISKVNDLFWIGDTLYVFTPFQLDALCLGICLALFDLKWLLKYWNIYMSILVTVIILVGSANIIYLDKFGIQINSLGFDAPVYHLLIKSPYPVLNNRYFYTYPLINIFFALLLLALINNRWKHSVFENRYLAGLGKISYSVYIYHLALSYFFILLMKPFFPDLTSVSIYFQILLMLLYLAFLFSASYFSYRYFELRFLKLKKNFQ